MEKAKAAISEFIAKDGKHKTTVEQDIAPAVTEEVVKPYQHEKITTAVDREVHKDHHYTTVQPVAHKEVLGEQHHHNIAPVEHKTVDHGGRGEVENVLQREAAQFADTTTTHSATHSQTVAPTVAGEHVHHHVHEHVQPVIHKEVVQPHVVHTTVPIHETHHVAPVYHGTKVAPTKTLDEFKSTGGIVGGRDTKLVQEFEGCPQTESGSDSSTHKHGLGSSDTTGTHNSSIKGALAGAAAKAGTGSHHHHNTHDGTNRDTVGAGTDGTADKHGSMFGKDKVGSGDPSQPLESRSFLNQGRKDIKETNLNNPSDNYRAGGTGTTGNTIGNVNSQNAYGGPAAVPRSENPHSHTTDSHTTGLHDGQPDRKVSLVDKLNPFKDADGDGKKGFMK